MEKNAYRTLVLNFSESRVEDIEVKDLKMEPNKIPNAKRAKKKQVKDELDRLKQAEKKRRRLEKALATSAAIRSELEKKKQMKKEEQQRLDEEGAAIAEAVALHVLIEEEADDSSAGDINVFMNTGSAFSNQDLQRCAFQSIREIPSSDDGYGYKWNQFERRFPSPYLEGGQADVSAGFSALQIGDANVDSVFFNRF